MITPIFSGGVGRSGTTLIGHLFKNHKDVFFAKPYEVKFITNVFGLVDLSFGMRDFPKTQITKYAQVATKISKFDSSQKSFIKFKKSVLGEWWDVSEYNPDGGLGNAMSKSTMEQMLSELESNLNNPVNAARNFLFSYVLNHKEYSGQKYWIDTSPTNIMYSDLIYNIFSEAKFIEMRRNPLDNIGAVLKQSWGPNDENFGIKWWSDRIKGADSAVAKIPSEKHILLTLEDFVKNERNKSYSALCSFIGISNNEQEVINYFNNNITIENANFDRWLTDFKNPTKFKNKFDNFIKQNNYNYRIDLTL